MAMERTSWHSKIDGAVILGEVLFAGMGGVDWRALRHRSPCRSEHHQPSGQP